MLLPFVRKDQKRLGKYMFMALLINGITLAIVIVCTLMGLGAMAGVYKFSLFSLARLIEIRDFVERIESVPGLVIIAGSYMKASIVMLVISLGISKLFRMKDYRILVFPVALIGLLLSLTMFNHEVEFMEFVGDIWPLVITLAGVFPIFALTLISGIKGWFGK